MKIVILAVFITLAFAGTHPVNHEIVAEIKAKATWTPMEPEENPFAYMPIEQIKAMMGTKLRVPESSTQSREVNDDDLPGSFDAREKWGSKIHPIRTQGKCGATWAFGATEAFSDRVAIATGVDVVLSPQQLISCDKGNSGCTRGWTNEAWRFMASTGVPSEDCYSYTSGTSGQRESCQATCDDGSQPTFYKAKNIVYGQLVKETKMAIMKDGPVEATFLIYEDFLNYRRGVYKQTTGMKLGGLSVKCLGWGREDGVDYWLMANSWGPDWGEQGYFKIGLYECLVTSELCYGEVDGTITASE